MKKEIAQKLEYAISTVVHCNVLGMKVKDYEAGKISMILPYSNQIIGDSDTGVIDGGALTTLLDTTCGFAAATAQGDLVLAPTLDLRIDYMKPATPGKDVISEAEAYKVSGSVIFTRGVAYHEGQRNNPIAHCIASFMRLDPSNMVNNAKFTDKEKQNVDA